MKIKGSFPVSMKISKYELYEASVQDSRAELSFFKRVYRNAFGKDPKVFREDFCSTFLNSVTWVKQAKDHVSYAVDRDEEPLEYGCKNHLAKLKPEQRERVMLFQKNVLDVKTPPADMITVSNFSICFLKERERLLEYLKSCHKALKSKGVMIMDMLGGEELPEETEDATKFELKDGTKATYFWEHAGFNPINSEAKFYIHYQIKGQKKMNRVFSYNWRMWSLPELKDLFLEAGFKGVDIYWEGDDPDSDEGNGVFHKAVKAQSCAIWVAYIVGVKK